MLAIYEKEHGSVQDQQLVVKREEGEQTDMTDQLKIPLTRYGLLNSQPISLEFYDFNVYYLPKPAKETKQTQRLISQWNFVETSFSRESSQWPTIDIRIIKRQKRNVLIQFQHEQVQLIGAVLQDLTSMTNKMFLVMDQESIYKIIGSGKYYKDYQRQEAKLRKLGQEEIKQLIKLNIEGNYQYIDSVWSSIPIVNHSINRTYSYVFVQEILSQSSKQKECQVRNIFFQLLNPQKQNPQENQAQIQLSPVAQEMCMFIGCLSQARKPIEELPFEVLSTRKNYKQRDKIFSLSLQNGELKMLINQEKEEPSIMMCEFHQHISFYEHIENLENLKETEGYTSQFSNLVLNENLKWDIRE